MTSDDVTGAAVEVERLPPWPCCGAHGHHSPGCDGRDPLDPALFPDWYKARMVDAYPVIARLARDEAWTATENEREAAFKRVLAARNLRRTHELYLESAPERQP